MNGQDPPHSREAGAALFPETNGSISADHIDGNNFAFVKDSEEMHISAMSKTSVAMPNIDDPHHLQTSRGLKRLRENVEHSQEHHREAREVHAVLVRRCASLSPTSSPPTKREIFAPSGIPFLDNCLTLRGRCPVVFFIFPGLSWLSLMISILIIS